MQLVCRGSLVMSLAGMRTIVVASRPGSGQRSPDFKHLIGIKAGRI